MRIQPADGWPLGQRLSIQRSRHAPWSTGFRGERNLPWSWSSDETLAGIQTACYERLGLPTEARAFTDALRVEMAEALEKLNRGMPRNPGVRLDPRRRRPIVVTPLEPQPEPLGLGAIKAELDRRWSGTGLLDVFKKADLRIGFTDAFCHRGVSRGDRP